MKYSIFILLILTLCSKYKSDVNLEKLTMENYKQIDDKIILKKINEHYKKSLQRSEIDSITIYSIRKIMPEKNTYTDKVFRFNEDNCFDGTYSSYIYRKYSNAIEVQVNVHVKRFKYLSNFLIDNTTDDYHIISYYASSYQFKNHNEKVKFLYNTEDRVTDSYYFITKNTPKFKNPNKLITTFLNYRLENNYNVKKIQTLTADLDTICIPYLIPKIKSYTIKNISELKLGYNYFFQVETTKTYLNHERKQLEYKEIEKIIIEKVHGYFLIRRVAMPSTFP